MKIPYLEEMATVYANSHPQFRKFYPRRIVVPHDYISPTYYAVIACAQIDNPLTPLEQRAISHHLANAEMPTYFIDGNFLQAILATTPRDKIPLRDIHLPLNEMLLMLPLSISRSFFCGFDVPIIGYTLADAKDKSGKLTGEHVFAFHAVLIPSDGRPLGYYGRIPTYEAPDEISKYDFKDNTELEQAYIRWSLQGSPDPNKHDEGIRLPTKEEDMLMPDKAFQLLYKLFMVLNTENATQRYITDKECVRKERPNKKHSKSELWSPAFIGKGYKPQREYQGGHHASPRLHWRRGHTRNQAYGPNMTLHKQIWIEPMLIGK